MRGQVTIPSELQNAARCIERIDQKLEAIGHTKVEKGTSKKGLLDFRWLLKARSFLTLIKLKIR